MKGSQTSYNNSAEVALPDIVFDPTAAKNVLTCEGTGLRAYAIAGGLNPATDFRGLDLSGWELTGQDLRGFDFFGCDLRSTGIQYALIDATTSLDDVLLDEGVVPGSAYRLSKEDPMPRKEPEIVRTATPPPEKPENIPRAAPLGSRVLHALSRVLTITKEMENLAKNDDRMAAQLLALAQDTKELTGELRGLYNRFDEVDKRIEAMVELRVMQEIKKLEEELRHSARVDQRSEGAKGH